MDDFALVLGSATAIIAMGLARLGTRSRSSAGSATTCSAVTASTTWRAAASTSRGSIRGGGLKTGVTVSITHPADRALVTYLGAIARSPAPTSPDAALRRPRPSPRLVVLLPGRAAARLPGPVRARAPGRAHHLARHRLRPERDAGTAGCGRRCARPTCSSRTRWSCAAISGRDDPARGPARAGERAHARRGQAAAGTGP